MTEATWSTLVAACVAAAGLARIVVRGELGAARGVDKLAVFGPVCFAAPLAGFGTEHFTFDLSSLVPSWIPWPALWAYVIGAGFIAAGFSIATGILARLAASVVAGTFFIFVAVMDVPAWLHEPDRFGLALALRELAFCGGALAIVASLSSARRQVLAAVARYFVAVPVMVYGVEQLLHGDHVPGVPLVLTTPSYIIGGDVWTYAAAAVYIVAGALLLAGRSVRLAATLVGAIVLVAIAAVYVPMAVVERGSIVSYNYLTDTLMFGGAALLVARAKPTPRAT